MRTFARLALLVVAMWMVVPTFAAKDPVDTEPFVYEPRRISEESITLEQALALTLENDPNVMLQEQSVMQQRGVVEEAEGRFDVLLNASLNLSYTQSELSPSQIDGEKKKREALGKEIRENTEEADALAILLGLLNGELDDLDNFELDSDDPLAQEINQQMALINALILAAAPQDREQIYALRDEFIADTLSQIQGDIDELRKLALDDIERLRKLGAIPTISEDFFGELTLGASKEYRSGLSLSPFFKLNGSDSNFKGKPEDSGFGGQGGEAIYKAETGINFRYPMGRGGSRLVVTAAEESAKKNLDASLALMEHSSSSSIFRTMLAYWGVVGAMERVRIARESLDLQNRLVELTRDLVEGDELPRTQMSQVEASASNSSANVRAAAQSLYEARVRLAQTMGLEVVSEADAPLASTAFPTPPEMDAVRRMDAAEIGEFAVMRRRDYAAAKAFEGSGRILYLAANHNLRSTLDLTGSLTYSGVSENPSFRGGVQGAVSQWVGPSVTGGIAWSRPVGNNTAKGQLMQSSAALSQSAIQTGDLRRTIKASVALTLGALEDAIAQIEVSRRTVEFYEDSLRTEADKLRLGQSTVIDVVVTEQRLTDARNALVASEFQYALLLTQLRFETATLIDGEGDSRSVSARDIMTLPFVN
jgi:outer membrane protein TolC